MTSNRAAPLLALLLLVACGRGVAIESEPGPVYTVAVENPMAHAMDVWVDDGMEARDLGRVDARTTREFVIAAPARVVVEIVARDEARTHTITRRVELRQGATPTVVLTP